MNQDNPMEATTHGSGQSVVVNLGEGWKNFQIILLALIISLVFSCTVSLVAFHEAKEAQLKADLWAYWGERVEANLQARGIDVPAHPK